MNRIIQFETKSHYGGGELVYVISEHKEPLQTLTGSKTLTPRHVEALKKLGFTFEEPPSKMIHLAMALRHLAYDLKEAGMKDWLKGLVAKIPGLPTKDQALKTVSEFLKKSPEKFDKIVDELLEVMKDVPISGLGRTAFDIKSLMRGIKTVTDPKVILAIIALMGMFQTADAGALRDAIQREKIEWQQFKQERNAPDTVKPDIGKQEQKKTTGQVLQDLFKGTNPILDEFLTQKSGRKMGTIEVIDSSYGKMTFGVGFSIDTTGGSPGSTIGQADRRSKIAEDFKVVYRVKVRVGSGLAVASISQSNEEPRSSMVPPKDIDREIKENAADLLNDMQGLIHF